MFKRGLSSTSVCNRRYEKDEDTRHTARPAGGRGGEACAASVALQRESFTAQRVIPIASDEKIDRTQTLL
ncbi:hypothetical protein EVAR_39336_1 [Eumeta japonica]|uniref:Uncharacterized protein n=1 Tax=Eumeta variegata TaxID=151549 RepID=A0A4C1WN43_EUMVA|nr:hypothetical protein EVAR_39336_1 [Eumeta japonica]